MRQIVTNCNNRIGWKALYMSITFVRDCLFDTLAIVVLTFHCRRLGKNFCELWQPGIDQLLTYKQSSGVRG